MKIPIGETAVVIRTDSSSEEKITKICYIALVEITGYYNTGKGNGYGYECKTIKKINLEKDFHSSGWHEVWIKDVPKMAKTQELLSKIPNLPYWVKRGALWSVS